MRTNKPDGLICFRDGTVALKPGSLGNPGFRGVDPEEPWRRLYERADQVVRRWAGYEIDDFADALYGPAGLKALPLLTWDVAVDLLQHPQTITPTWARELLDALLDGRQAVHPDVESLREALYQMLKARRQLEGSRRLKALQRLEGCRVCKRIDFEVHPDGRRECECGRQWAPDVEVRVRTVKARNSRAENPKERNIEIQERTLVAARGRTLIQVEI
jgi:hypothetical protein